MFTVYILQSEKTGRHYIGFTSDLEKRLQYHNGGKNKSTKNDRPWRVIWREVFENKKDAWLREHQIKRFKGGEAFKKLINRL